jgi:hypothetical protein
VIYAADCHTLKKDEVTDVKIADYFLWKERSLFEIKIAFEGQNVTSHQYGQDEDHKINTTITYEYVSSDVINNLRENKFPKNKPDGTYVIEKSDSFNPEGIYGKIQDSDLIKIRHNPCFNCKFTAWVVLRKKTSNLVVSAGDYDDEPVPPEKPDDSYDQWNIVSGPDVNLLQVEGQPVRYSYLVNAGQRSAVTLFMTIHPGFIDPKTRNLGEVFTFTGWLRELEEEEKQNATIKIGKLEYARRAQIEDGITVEVEWRPKGDRPA